MITVSTEEKNAVEKGKLKKEVVKGNTHRATLLTLCAKIVFPARALRRGRKDRAEGEGGGGRLASFMLGSGRLCAPTGERNGAASPERAGWRRGQARNAGQKYRRFQTGLGGWALTYFYNCSINCSLKSHKPVLPVY